MSRVGTVGDHLLRELETEGAGAAGGGRPVLQQTHPPGVTHRVLVSPGLHDVTLLSGLLLLQKINGNKITCLKHLLGLSR